MSKQVELHSRRRIGCRRSVVPILACAGATIRIAALGNCRPVMIAVLRTVKPMGPTYHRASMVIAAIDGLGATITGELEPFAVGGSVAPERAAEVRAQMREVGTSKAPSCDSLP